jgi:hypothetical protein
VRQAKPGARLLVERETGLRAADIASEKHGSGGSGNER